jgi:hypothetical protein
LTGCRPRAHSAANAATVLMNDSACCGKSGRGGSGQPPCLAISVWVHASTPGSFAEAGQASSSRAMRPGKASARRTATEQPFEPATTVTGVSGSADTRCWRPCLPPRVRHESAAMSSRHHLLVMVGVVDRGGGRRARASPVAPPPGHLVSRHPCSQRGRKVTLKNFAHEFDKYRVG